MAKPRRIYSPHELRNMAQEELDLAATCEREALRHPWRREGLQVLAKAHEAEHARLMEQADRLESIAGCEPEGRS